MGEQRGPAMAPPPGNPAVAYAPPASVGYVAAAAPVGGLPHVHPTKPGVMPVGAGHHVCVIEDCVSSRRTSTSSGAHSLRSGGRSRRYDMTDFPGCAGGTPHPSVYAKIRKACNAYADHAVTPEAIVNSTLLMVRGQDQTIRQVEALKDVVRAEADGLSARIFEVAAFYDTRVDLVINCMRDLNDHLLEIHAMLAQVWERGTCPPTHRIPLIQCFACTALPWSSPCLWLRLLACRHMISCVHA
jgi:hypothetical protein